MTDIYYETGRNANFGLTLQGPQSKPSACSDSAAFVTDIYVKYLLFVGITTLGTEGASP